MKYLPSEQKRLIEMALRSLSDGVKVNLFEPCDCGSQIRHNNGGNYHDIIALQKEERLFIGEKYYKWVDSSYEYNEGAWNVVTKEEAEETIRKHVDWLQISKQLEEKGCSNYKGYKYRVYLVPFTGYRVEIEGQITRGYLEDEMTANEYAKDIINFYEDHKHIVKELIKKRRWVDSDEKNNMSTR